MALKVGELFASLRLDDKQFNSGMKQSESKFRGMGGSLVAMAGGFAASMGAAFSVALVTKTGIAYSTLMEQSQVAWSTILGDAEKAEGTIKMLERLGASTPFEFEGLDKAAKKLTMADLGGKDLEKTLIAVGDAVAATGGGTAELEGVSTALFQMASKGKVSAEEMNQMAERGIPVWKMLSEKMGMPIPQLMKMSEKGELLAKEALPALIDGFGKFGGAMDAQSKTFGGMSSTLKDGMKVLSAELTKPLFEALKSIMPKVIETVDDLIAMLKSGGVKEALVGMFPPEIAAAATKIFTAITDTASAFYESFMSVFYDTGEVKDLLGAIGISPEIATEVEAFFGVLISAFQSIPSVIEAFVSFAKDRFEQFKALFTGNNDLVSSFVSIFMTIKSIVAPILTDMIAFIREKFGMIKQFWDENGAQFVEAVKNLWAVIAAIFKAVAPVIIFIVKMLWGSVKGVIDGALKIIMGIIKIFIGLFTGDFKKMWEGVKQLFVGALQFVWNLLTLMFVGRIVQLIKLGTVGMINLIKAFWKQGVSFFKGLGDDALRIIGNMVSGVGTKFSAMWNQARTIFSILRQFGEGVFKALFNTVRSVVSNIASTVKSYFTTAKNSAISAFNSLKNGVMTAMQGALSWVKNAASNIKTTLSELGTKAIQFGKDLISGLINGIKAKAKEVIGAAKKVAGDIINGIKTVFDTNSPSKVTTQIGKWVGQGLGIGIASTKTENQKAIDGVAKVILGVTKAMNAEIKAVTKAATAEQSAIAKKAATEIAEIQKKTSGAERTAVQKAIKDVAEIHARAKDANRKLTQAEHRKIADINAKASATGHKLTTSELASIKKIKDEAHIDIVKSKQKQKDEIARIEADENKERLDAVKQFIENKKKMEELSLIDEAAIWRKASMSFKEGTQEKIDAQIQYRDALARVNDEITSINDTYAKRMQDINKNLLDEEVKLTETYTKTLSDRYNALMSFSGIFDKFDAIVEQSGSELLDNLNSQVEGFKKWQSEIEAISGKAIDGGLLGELREMGPKALPQLLALNSLTEEQLAEYSRLYQEKSVLARQQAEAELVGMKADTAKRIQELRAAANAELDVLNSEWTKKIQDLTKATNKEFAVLTTIGKDAIKGLMAGMDSMTDPLMAKAKLIADSVAKAMRTALQIKSPSKVMKAIGAYSGEGFIDGLDGTIAMAKGIAAKLAIAVAPRVQVPSASKGRPALTSIPERRKPINIDYDKMATAIAKHNKPSVTIENTFENAGSMSVADNQRNQRQSMKEMALQWG